MNIANKKRVKAIDLVRGIGVFFIPMAHTLLIYGTNEIQTNSWLGITVHFFGKWAGIFLLTMGFSFAMSKRNSPWLSVKRGAMLLAVGYLMNLLKLVVPAIIGIFPDSFLQAYGWNTDIEWQQLVYLLLTGDILQLGGVSLLFMGFIRQMTKKQKYLPLIITILIIALLEFVRGYRLGIDGVDYLLDLIWGTEWNIYFAIFPWFGYILIGMFFGNMYTENETYDLAKTFKNILYFAIPSLCLGGLLCYVDYEYHMKDYFHLGVGGFIYLLGWNLMFLWLMYYLEAKIKRKLSLFNLFYYCSERITSLYITQWFVICWGMYFFGYHSKDMKESIILMIVITAITLGIQKIIDLKTTFKLVKKTSVKADSSTKPKKG